MPTGLNGIQPQVAGTARADIYAQRARPTDDTLTAANMQ